MPAICVHCMNLSRFVASDCDPVRKVPQSVLAVATFFKFLTTVHEIVPNMVGTDDDRRLHTQLGDALAPLLVAI